MLSVFGEMFIDAESIVGKKIFIKFYGIESRIAKEGFWIDQRALKRDL